MILYNYTLIREEIITFTKGSVTCNGDTFNFFRFPKHNTRIVQINTRYILKSESFQLFNNRFVMFSFVVFI